MQGSHFLHWHIDWEHLLNADIDNIAARTYTTFNWSLKCSWNWKTFQQGTNHYVANNEHINHWHWHDDEMWYINQATASVIGHQLSFNFVANEQHLRPTVLFLFESYNDIFTHMSIYVNDGQHKFVCRKKQMGRNTKRVLVCCWFHAEIIYYWVISESQYWFLANNSGKNTCRLFTS